MIGNPYLNGAFGIPPNPYAAMHAPQMPQAPLPYPQFPSQPMKTPEQYKEDLLKQVQPQLTQYEDMYRQTQAQAQLQANSGNYFKVGSYDEVKAIQAPADGRPVMIFDEINGRLYSKRFENGQAYIRGFSLVPLEEAAEEAKPQPQQQQGEGQDKLDLILGRFDSLEKRIADLEGRKDGSV